MTPVPTFWLIIIVAAAAFELVLDAAELEAAVAEGTAELEELDDVEAPVKLSGFRWPQFFCSFVVQTAWAAWSFWPVTMQFW